MLSHVHNFWVMFMHGEVSYVVMLCYVDVIMLNNEDGDVIVRIP